LDRGRALGMSFLKKSAAVVLTVGAFGFATQPFAAKGHGGDDVAEAMAPRTNVLNENGMYFFCTPQPPQEPTTVVIQNCEGKIIKRGKGCEGPSREVKRKDFFNELRDQIKIENLAGLKPLSKEDIRLYNTPEGQPAELRQVATFDKARAVEKIKELEQEMLKLAPSEQAKKLPELKALKQALEASEKLIAKANATEQEMKLAIKKVNDALDKVTDVNICDSSVTYNLDKDSNSFLSTVLKQYDPKPVGKRETLANGMLELVKREVGADGKNRDFWKDVSKNTRTKKLNNLIWGPLEDFKKIKELQEKLKLTVNLGGKEIPDYARAAEEYCKSIGMDLPTKDDFLDALGNPDSEKTFEASVTYPFGRNKALTANLPEMKDRRFLTSSPFRTDSNSVFYFDGPIGEVGYLPRNYPHFSVRCVDRDA
jgi:hypothetical protein